MATLSVKDKKVQSLVLSSRRLRIKRPVQESIISFDFVAMSSKTYDFVAMDSGTQAKIATTKHYLSIY